MKNFWRWKWGEQKQKGKWEQLMEWNTIREKYGVNQDKEVKNWEWKPRRGKCGGKIREGKFVVKPTEDKFWSKTREGKKSGKGKFGVKPREGKMWSKNYLGWGNLE